MADSQDTVATNMKTALNNCKALEPYTMFGDLQDEKPYKIVKFEKVLSPYGLAVLCTLESHIGDDDFYLRVFLPKRFHKVFDDYPVEEYNAVGEGISLVKKRPTDGSSYSPLVFV